MKYRKHIINLILFFLIIMCFGLSISFSNRVKDGKRIGNIYLEKDALTGADVVAMRENEEDNIYSYTAWRQIDNESITYRDLNRYSTVNILKISGDSSLIVKGPILFQDDINGCLIDSEAAYTLFGSDKVIGQVIDYNGKELTIRGVHKGVKNTLVIQAEERDTDSMDAVALDISKGGEKLIKNFSMKYGFSEDYVDSYIYYYVANFFILLIPIIIFFIIVSNLIKPIIKVQNKPVKLFIYLCISGLIIYLLIKIIGIKIKIPYDLIPNKWSDFGYWSELFKSYQEKYETILFMKKFNMDIVMIKDMIKSIFFSISSLILFLSFRKRLEVKSERELFFYTIFILLLEFIAILVIEIKYELTVTGYMIWFLIPYYFAVKYLIFKEKSYEI